MAKKAPTGLEQIRRKQLEKKTHAQLIEIALKSEFSHGGTLIREGEAKSAYAERNRAGAVSRAATFAQRKVIAGEVYLKLRKSLKRNPSSKEFLRAYEEHRPNDVKLTKLSKAEREWWDLIRDGGGGLEKWWKAMNKR